jgi:formylmethanofuran dehydrogenase subunit A
MYITVEQIKQHLYIDFEADDAVLEDMINTVEAIIEKYLNVQLADLVVDEKLPYPISQSIKIMVGN